MLLKEMSRSDQLLVKHVTIVGDGFIQDFDSHYANYSDTGICTVPEDCVVNLLSGKLLDISGNYFFPLRYSALESANIVRISKVIETLHVRNLHETPDSKSPWAPARFKFKTASKLRELSIWGHQGGSIIWKAFLDKKKKMVPELRRLGFVGVTSWSREVLDWDSQGLHLYSMPEEKPANLDKTAPFPQLDVIAATPSFDPKSLPKFPLDKFLGIISLDRDELSLEDVTSKFKYLRAVPRARKRWETDEELEPALSTAYSRFLTQVSQVSGSIKFLCLPASFVGQPLTDPEIAKKIQALKSAGVEVQLEEEEEEDSSVVSPSFVEYLKRQSTVGKRK